jgi:hypothetical protein
MLLTLNSHRFQGPKSVTKRKKEKKKKESKLTN